MDLLTVLRWVGVTSLLVAPAVSADIFSPGPLSRAHQTLEGIENCVKCHPSGEKLAATSCLSCHEEIGTRIDANRGLHGRMDRTTRQTCWSCHHEHRGSDVDLLGWEGGPKKFDHQRTGFALLGKHRETECERCHEPRLIADGAVLKMLKEQPRRRTYLGAPNLCAACHFDEHRNQVGQLCGKCHDEREFKPAPRFDHDQDARFPLRGKHERVECAECHPVLTDTRTSENAFPAPASRTFLKFAPLAYKGCATCHEDVHDGKFGTRCESCHTEQGFRIIKKLDADREFHQKTRYPLEGLHVDVPCASCHGPAPGRKLKLKGLAFERCDDCHADAHLGQLERRPARRDCEECHGVEGFMPPRFPFELHAKTRYPLEGAHTAVACDRCHAQDPKLKRQVPRTLVQLLKREKRPLLVNFAVFDFPRALDRCETCHADPHGGQLEGPCTRCHEVAAWSKLSRFDHDAHSRFPLEGKHREAACGSCHRAERSGLVRYRPLSLTCEGCHADPHAGQLTRQGTKGGCARCHRPTRFDERLFEHEEPFTRFKLDGKHTEVACERCHPRIDVGSGKQVARYVPLPVECAGCHEDFHHGEFEGFEP